MLNLPLGAEFISWNKKIIEQCPSCGSDLELFDCGLIKGRMENYCNNCNEPDEYDE